MADDQSALAKAADISLANPSGGHLMPIRFPQLDAAKIEWLSVCVVFSKDNVALGKLIPEDYSAKRRTLVGQGESAYYVHVLVGRFSDLTFHLHINLVSASHLDPDDEFPGTETDLDGVADLINKFADHTAFLVLLRSISEIPIDALPEHGLPRSMDELETEVGGETLALAGASFSISGEPFDKLEWEYDGDDVTSRLFASVRDCKVDDRFLVDMHEMMVQGIDRFLISEDEYGS